MNKAPYRQYVDRFNNRRCDALAIYFLPGITVECFTDFY